MDSGLQKTATLTDLSTKPRNNFSLNALRLHVEFKGK